MGRRLREGEKRKDAERALAVAGEGDSAASEKDESRRQIKIATRMRGRTSEKRRFDRALGGSEVC